MRIGTRSLLFGVHQFAIHPWFVAWGWWRLYGFPWDPRLWIAFVIHDWGYWGKPNMDEAEGETHPDFAALVMSIFNSTTIVNYEYEEWSHGDKGVPWLAGGDAFNQKRLQGWRIVASFNLFTLLGRPVYGFSWSQFCYYHSRFLAKRDSQPFSRLCVADKLAIALFPAWLYLPLARLSGELTEYMEGKGARTPAGERNAKQWYRDVPEYSTVWAMTHKDCRPDTWTGTIKDLARDQ